MRVAHVLRKYNPKEWGGTETVLKNLCIGLQDYGVESVAFCPQLQQVDGDHDPLASTGCQIKRYKAMMPILGISAKSKQQLVSIGGNLLSFDLPWMLWKEKELSLIHTHTLNRLGATALLVAKMRRLPLVVTIHGGALDLPQQAREKLNAPAAGGWEWGKCFGWLLQSRSLLEHADAILTCNDQEAQLLRARYPQQRVIVQPHSLDMTPYLTDQRQLARKAFPSIANKKLIVMAARVHPIKNQGWLIAQMPAILRSHPDAMLMIVGPSTDLAYSETLARQVQLLGIDKRVVMTGGLPPNDPLLIGLLQSAKAVVIPSIMEPFGLAILEAWAAGAPVLASRTSGPEELITDTQDGFLFDLNCPEQFHQSLDRLFTSPDLVDAMTQRGKLTVQQKYSPKVIMEQVKSLYESLTEDKNTKKKVQQKSQHAAPKVSIVIPAYNSINTISQCLEALKKLKEGTPTHEIIVADNGSKDGTYEFLCNYPGIIVTTENNYQSAGAARNAGLKLATGEFIAFLDADCIASPQWLIEAIPIFFEKNVAGVAGEIKGAEPKNYIQRWLNDRKMFDQRWTLAYKTPNIQTGNAIYRRSDLEKIRGFDPMMIVAEDTDISWRILQETGGRFVYAPNAIVTHIHHDNIRGVLWQAKKNAMTDAYMAMKWKEAYPTKNWKQSTRECLDIVKYGGQYLFTLARNNEREEVENVKFEFLFRLARKTGMIIAALKLRQWKRW